MVERFQARGFLFWRWEQIQVGERFATARLLCMYVVPGEVGRNRKLEEQQQRIDISSRNSVARARPLAKQHSPDVSLQDDGVMQLDEDENYGLNVSDHHRQHPVFEKISR